MIQLESRPDGVVLPVRAQPGGRVNAIRGEQNGALKVSVTQVAEKGKANRALIEVLAKSLQLRKSQVHLIAGETSSQKRFLVTGIAPSELQTRLNAALADDASAGR
jgi:uncharacterized protein (TIGR00251 family)